MSSEVRILLYPHFVADVAQSVEHFLGKEEVIGSSPIISSHGNGANTDVSSLIGRAAVSKTAGWGFESLLTCRSEEIYYIRFFMSKYLDKVTGYYRDVVNEMRKVSWPGREEIKDLTVVVLTVSGILALFTFVVDWAISGFISQLL